MLAARLALSSALLVAAFALSTAGSAPAAIDAFAPVETLTGWIDHPRFVGRLLDVDAEPFVGEITLNCRIDFPESAARPYEVTSRTDASGAFDVAIRTPRRFSRPTDFVWTLAPRSSVLYGDFALAPHDARRAAGTLAFESGEDGAVIGDIGTVQLLEAPRVGSLRIDSPVATTHAVAVHEDSFKNSPKAGPFDNPFEAFDVATGNTVELFSWSAADRWHVFTNPATRRSEHLMAVIERGQDLVLFSRECFEVCVSIDAPPTAQGALQSHLVVMPLLSATTGTRLGPHDDPVGHWLAIRMPPRGGPLVFHLDPAERELDFHLPAGLHRFEFWDYEHVLDGPLHTASAAVYSDRFVDLHAWR